MNWPPLVVDPSPSPSFRSCFTCRCQILPSASAVDEAKTLRTNTLQILVNRSVLCSVFLFSFSYPRFLPVSTELRRFDVTLTISHHTAEGWRRTESAIAVKGMAENSSICEICHTPYEKTMNQSAAMNVLSMTPNADCGRADSRLAPCLMDGMGWDGIDGIENVKTHVDDHSLPTTPSFQQFVRPDGAEVCNSSPPFSINK